jgi:8-oxo-dGTP pyrophosphatase MutT (NUDIX family)
VNYLDYIAQCNAHDLSDYLPLQFEDHGIGYLHKRSLALLQAWPAQFRIGPERVLLIAEGESAEARSREWNRVIEALSQDGALPYLTGEPYPVTAGGREQALFVIDRAAAPLFGIRAFGQHVNGYVRRPDGLYLWVGRRSADRRNFPGKLDHLVAGGLPHGISLRENLVKECWEEAGIPGEMALGAVAVGAVTYVAESERGLKPDTLYCYDLELPESFQPRCTDGEVESFALWPMSRVMETLLAGPSFKLNCNLVIIDFLIRHGYIDPEHEAYLELISGLHPRLP